MPIESDKCLCSVVSAFNLLHFRDSVRNSTLYFKVYAAQKGQLHCISVLNEPMVDFIFHLV